MSKHLEPPASASTGRRSSATPFPTLGHTGLSHWMDGESLTLRFSSGRGPASLTAQFPEIQVFFAPASIRALIELLPRLLRLPLRGEELAFEVMHIARAIRIRGHRPQGRQRLLVAPRGDGLVVNRDARRHISGIFREAPCGLLGGYCHLRKSRRGR